MAKDAFDINDLEGKEHERIFTVLREGTGLRLDRFLQGKLHWMSRASVQRLIESGAAGCDAPRLGESTLKCATRLAEGDRIRVRIPRDPKDQAEADRDPVDLDILFEDDRLVAVNKPAGVPVHPVGINLHRTVLTALHLRYRRPGEGEGDSVPRLAHRLDLETSGVLVAAKDRETMAELARQFRAKTVEKSYLALVYGKLEEDEGQVDLPLGPAENGKIPYRRAVRRDGGSEAVTRFKVLDRRADITMVLLFPRTGRKHQLRVHMAALGHPIVGDKIYGPDEKYYFKAREGPPDGEDLKALLLPRQALHAYRLSLQHPGHGGRVRIEAPVPKEFEALMKPGTSRTSVEHPSGT